jgi:CheY-like chemotaxis protein
VLMDNEMPVMRGRDAVKLMRDLKYQGRILGVTGNVLQADIDDFLAQGVNQVILKPLTIDKFKQALEDVNKYED